MSEQVSTAARPAPAPKRPRKRGRESAGDMVRSLGLVLLLVVALWFLARPPGSDAQPVRTVDPTSDLAGLQQAAPGVPVPHLPTGWRATSSTLDPDGLRIGWLTPAGQYAEYAASRAPGFLADITGHGRQVGTYAAGGSTWMQYADAEEHTTLVRLAAGRTVAVGGVRETSSLDELHAMAAAVS